MVDILWIERSSVLIVSVIGVINCIDDNWHRCLNRSFHFGKTMQTYNDSVQYCDKRLGNVANFSNSPSNFIENLDSSCPNVSLKNEQRYWILKTERKNAQCQVVKPNGGHFEFHNISCLSKGYAICERDNNTNESSNSTYKASEWISFHSVEYKISKTQIGYNECSQHCANISSFVAHNVSNDITKLLGEKLDSNKRYWVNVRESLNTPTDATMCRAMVCLKTSTGCSRVGFKSFDFNCTLKAYCICKKDLVKQKKEDVRIKRITSGVNEFVILYDKNNYAESDRICHSRFNASLVIFHNTMSYIHNLRKWSLRNGSFWVKDHGYLDENIQRDCLSYNSIDETISSIPCENKQYGICICSSCNKSNTYDLENDKIFMELLQNMTVDSKRTSRNRRKKGSAEDRRQSSKAIGVFSALFLCAIVLLIVLADLSKLKTRKTS